MTCQADYDDEDSFINDLFGINDLDGEFYFKNKNYVPDNKVVSCAVHDVHRHPECDGNAAL